MSPTGDDIPSASHGEAHDLETAAALSGMPADLILELRSWRLTAWGTGPDRSGISFDTRSIYRLRQIENLRQECRLGLESLRLVAELMERLDAAETELRKLREKGH